jgi:hypothetical protein
VLRLAPGAAGLLAVVLAAGCGGGAKKPATPAKTAACLHEQGVKTTSRLGNDFVASAAPDGAFRADLGQNEVTISFAEDDDGAEQIANAYRRFRGQNIGIESVLRVDRNVVLLWKETPSPGDEGVAEGCLK